MAEAWQHPRSVEETMIDEEREARGNGSSGENRRVAGDPTAAAKLEIAATRERMSGTIAEIEQRVSGTMERAKQKVDVIDLVKRHPWPALAAALVAGVALGATGADRRAARATARAAKSAPGAAKRGVGRAAEATKAGVSQLAERLGGSDESTSGASSGGLKGKATSALRAIGDEVKRGADELSELSRAT